MRGIGLERQVAQFVDDQQLRFRELGQLLLKPTLSMRLGKLGDQRRSGHEQDREAGDCQESCVRGHSDADGGRLWRSRKTPWTSFWTAVTRKRFSTRTGFSTS